MNKKSLSLEFDSIKALDDNGGFEGYASVFGVQDYDGDVIVRGAFKKSIESGKQVKMLWQHDRTTIIGKWTEIREDEKGLFVKGVLFTELDKGREAYILLKNGVLNGMSVGFNIQNAYQEESTRNQVIDDADLWEISLVTWGANPEALITNVKTVKDFEQFLRDAGYSRKEAKTITSHGYKALQSQRDADGDEEVNQELINSLKSVIHQLEVH